MKLRMYKQLFVKKYEKLINIFLIILLIISLLIAIRESDLPLVINNDFAQILFCHSSESDGILSGIITGYITGYFVYLLTVLIPNAIKVGPINYDVIMQVRDIYSRSILTLLLMYKAVCNEEEWTVTLEKDDIDCLEDDFFEKIRRFYLCAEAHSLYIKNVNDESRRLFWYEYLQAECSFIQEKLCDLFSCYSQYLDYELVDILQRFKNAHYLGMMSGNDQDCENIMQGGDGYLYFDSISVSMYYATTPNAAPFFDNSINRDRLMEYVSILKELTPLMVKHSKDGFVKRQISKLHNPKAGKLGSAIFVYSKGNNA